MFCGVLCCIGAKNAIPLDTLACWGEKKASLLRVLHASVALLCSNLMLMGTLAAPEHWELGLVVQLCRACDALLDVFSPISSIHQSNQNYDLYIICVGEGGQINLLPILPRACLGRSHDSPTHIAGEHRTGTLVNLKGILTKRELTSLSCKFRTQREPKLQTPPAKINWTILRTPLQKLCPFNAGSWGLGCLFVSLRFRVQH